ncbi:MAG: hypothetical protein IJA60_07145 [Clostridia bacterium]|nr:hypothetical protein [Clostridia bacterium]
MKIRVLILAVAMVFFLAACIDKSENVNGETESTAVAIVTESATSDTTTETTVETAAVVSTKENTTAEVTTEGIATAETAVKKKEQPKEFDIDKTSSVENYSFGAVEYKADFDGDGNDETCTVKVVGHGTQCYVEQIKITRENGERIVVEHPITAKGMRSYFHKYKDYYNIYLDDAYDDITYPFDTLATPEEHLTNISFGDIFDYSVIGNKLYFRGSLACSMSEILGDVVYEYTYHDGALKVSRIGYRDYIGGVDYDLCDVVITSSLLVEPCMGGEVVLKLPDAEPLVSASAIMKQPEFFVYEKGLTYYVKWQNSPLKEDYTYTKYTLTLPAGYTDGEIISDGPGGGSGELGFLVRAKKGTDDVALWYLFYADRLAAPVEVWENEHLTFTPDEGTRLNDLYAYSPYYIARQYVNTDNWVLYYIIDLPDGQRIRYDKEDGAHPPMAKDILTFADVNFDGIEDLCLKLGSFGAQGAVNVRAYLGNDDYETYTLCESFEDIPNPVIDAENRQILGTNRESAGEYSYRKFEFKNGEFVKTLELLYNVDNETVEIGGEVLSAEEFTISGSEWDIESTKWFNILTE